MLKWNKLGKVFDPTTMGNQEWMSEYAQIPFPMVVDEERLRIYFATRPKPDSDLQYVSRSGYIEVMLNDVTKPVKICDAPIFDLGGIGTFDEFGSMTSSFVKKDDDIFAYYTGWTRMESVPYTMANGLAISNNGGKTFSRYSDGPIMGITPEEPFLLSGPIVRIIDGNWHMWYLTGTKWLHHENKYEPVYKIAHATSDNGIVWSRNGESIIPSVVEDECQVSFALFNRINKWHSIFAYRCPTDFRNDSSRAYRLGYCWSEDLETWHRQDDELIGLGVSDDGWDSQMLCYPQVLDHDGKVYLFYCGNNFGRVGFGVAELIEYS